MRWVVGLPCFGTAFDTVPGWGEAAGAVVSKVRPSLFGLGPRRAERCVFAPKGGCLWACGGLRPPRVPRMWRGH